LLLLNNKPVPLIPIAASGLRRRLKVTRPRPSNHRDVLVKHSGNGADWRRISCIELTIMCGTLLLLSNNKVYDTVFKGA
jgi:hypothetical protein